MELYGYEIQREKDLSHHGIKGMRWGVRRYQNEDGTLTNAGKKRYGDLGVADRNDLATYGVKGYDRIQKSMKSGKDRKAARRYELDLNRFGKKKAKRIDEKMTKKHYSHQQAVATERAKVILAAMGAVAIGVPLFIHRKEIGYAAAKTILKGAETISAKVVEYKNSSSTPRLAQELVFDTIRNKWVPV